MKKYAKTIRRIIAINCKITLSCINLLEYFLLALPPLNRVPIPRINTIPTAIKNTIDISVLNEKEIYNVIKEESDKRVSFYDIIHDINTNSGRTL